MAGQLEEALQTINECLKLDPTRAAAGITKLWIIVVQLCRLNRMFFSFDHGVLFIKNPHLRHAEVAFCQRTV
ncbi:hypothetical protein KU735_24530, partial [Salmonella enterica subsp. enterica serovar Give]|nr:hypothetical protein [Salmonella enterica subsp. enterica serovar Give]